MGIGNIIRNREKREGRETKRKEKIGVGRNSNKGREELKNMKNMEKKTQKLKDNTKKRNLCYKMRMKEEQWRECIEIA